MKRTAFFRIVALVAVITLTTFDVKSQNVMYELNAPAPQNSIIRVLNDSVYIMFDTSSTTSTAFYYVIINGGTAIKAQTPFPYNVTDFEILDDMVFFCGRSLNQPIFGVFNIYNTFFMGVNIPFYTFPMVTSSPGFFDDVAEKVVELNKLDVHKVDYKIHTYMVGKSIFAPNYDTTSCVVDVYPSGGGLTFEMVSDRNINYIFDDLATTDSRLVVAGHQKYSLMQNMHEYKYSWSSASYGILGHAQSNSIDLIHAGTSTRYSDVRIEHIVNDLVMVAYWGLIGGNSHVAIEMFNGASSEIYRSIIANTTGILPIYDFRYNANSNTLYILPYRTTHSLYQIDLNTSLEPTNDYLHIFNYMMAFSMDAMQSVGGFVASGANSSNRPAVWRATSGQAIPCDDVALIDKLSYSRQMIYPSIFQMSFCKGQLIPYSSSQTRTYHPLNVFCY